MSRIVMECPSGHDSEFTHDEYALANGLEVTHLFTCVTCGRTFARTILREIVNPGGLETVTMMPTVTTWKEVGRDEWRGAAITIKAVE